MRVHALPFPKKRNRASRYEHACESSESVRSRLEPAAQAQAAAETLEVESPEGLPAFAVQPEYRRRRQDPEVARESEALVAVDVDEDRLHARGDHVIGHGRAVGACFAGEHEHPVAQARVAGQSEAHWLRRRRVDRLLLGPIPRGPGGHGIGDSIAVFLPLSGVPIAHRPIIADYAAVYLGRCPLRSRELAPELRYARLDALSIRHLFPSRKALPFM